MATPNPAPNPARNPAPARLPLIGIACDVRQLGAHPFHIAGEKYIDAVAHGAGALPLLVPAFGAGTDLHALDAVFAPEALLDRLDGLFLPGSVSNVEPHHYGGPPPLPDTPADPQRDATTLALIRLAVARGVPLFAVCRGFQEMNVALGGTLHPRLHELPGRMDHREPPEQPREVQYGPAHPVRLTPGGRIATLLGSDSAVVNSLHWQGVERLAPGLTVEAEAPDGQIEAASVTDAPAFALGVQWHPEWRWREHALSRVLFAGFGDAARARAAQRC